MLNIFQLKYFYDACRLGSLTLSAKHNSISHPAVSQAIRTLESSLNVSLLEHKKKNFILTQQGDFLFEKCEELFQFLDSLRNGLNARDTVVSGKVLLGLSRTVAQAILPQVLKHLSVVHPALEVVVTLGTTREIHKLLASRSIDIGISISDEKEDEFSGFTLKEGKFQVIGPQKAVKNRLAFFVTETRPEVSALKTVLKLYPNSVNFSNFCQIESWDLISALVSDGLGFGMVPDLVLKGDNKKKLRQVNLRGFNFCYAVRVSFRPSKSRTVEAFLTAIKNLKFN